MLEIIEDGDILTVRTKQSWFDNPAIKLGFVLAWLAFIVFYVIKFEFEFWNLFYAVAVLSAIPGIVRSFEKSCEIRINREGKTIAVRHKGLLTDDFKVISFNHAATQATVDAVDTTKWSLLARFGLIPNDQAYELFLMTTGGEKIALADRQNGIDQLNTVADWLNNSLAKLPSPPRETVVLNLNP